MIKDKLKTLRESNKLSRKELSEILKCSISHICNLETGAARLTDDSKSILEEHFDLPENYFGIADDAVPVMTTDYDKIIGRNIKFYRKQNNMTQQILAEEMGYSAPSSVSAIERGQKPIGKKKLIQLAEIFNIHISELFSTSDVTMSSEEDVLLNKFIYLVKSKEKPSTYQAIKELIDSGCRELRRQSKE